jgi:imidazolonepropionase-like amidohydrolase
MKVGKVFMKERISVRMAVVLTAVFISGAGLQAQEVAAEVAPKLTIIKAGKLIDTVNGKVLENQMILIEDDMIKEVGTNITVTGGATVVDLTNSFVLPGLIDCHTHITGQAADRRLTQNPWIDGDIIAHIYPKRTLLAGFTSIRSLGSGGFGGISLMRAIDSGIIDGPRIQAAGFYIGSTGSHGDHIGGSPWESTKLPKEMSGIADGVDAVRKKVRYLVKYGAKVIKFGAGAGVLSGEDSVSAPQYSQEEMNAIVKEAHFWGLRVAAHAHGNEAIKMAIRAGVNSIEHGSFLDDEAIKMMKEKGIFLVADVYVDDYILAEYEKLGASKKIIEKEKLVGLTQRESFKKATAAGVNIAYGTDAGVYPHGNNALQLAFMVEWGQTPMQAIQSATINAADLMDWKDKVGSVSVGKFADIIAVEADPLGDVKALENVSFVMKGGKIYKR